MMALEHANSLATKFVHWLETGTFPEGLFTADVFFDVSVPQWRVQAQGVDESVGLRQQMHPFPGRVPRWRCDPTPTGFIIEFEESWHDQGEAWYCREMARADVRGDSIAGLSVYCTGDWDTDRRAEHAQTVRLLRP